MRPQDDYPRPVSLPVTPHHTDTSDYIYLVGWPGTGVMKVGYASRLRYRVNRYISRGGLVLGWHELRSQLAAFAREDRLHAEFDLKWDRAFSSAREAVPLVGGHGSGWTECFRTSDADASTALRLFEVVI